MCSKLNSSDFFIFSTFFKHVFNVFFYVFLRFFIVASRFPGVFLISGGVFFDFPAFYDFSVLVRRVPFASRPVYPCLIYGRVHLGGV